MDREAWWAKVHKAAKNQTTESTQHTQVLRNYLLDHTSIWTYSSRTFIIVSF